MPNLSRVNVIEYYNRLLNQIYSSIKNEKEMLISAINEMEQMKKELFKHEPPKYMFIKYKKWKTIMQFIQFQN